MPEYQKYNVQVKCALLTFVNNFDKINSSLNVSKRLGERQNKQHQQSENTSPEPAMRSTGRGSKSLTRRRWTLKEKSRRPSISDARTLNGDRGFELPAIFNHLLSRDYKFTRQLGAFIVHEDFAIQSKATRKKSESLRLEFILSICSS